MFTLTAVGWAPGRPGGGQLEPAARIRPGRGTARQPGGVGLQSLASDPARGHAAPVPYCPSSPLSSLRRPMATTGNDLRSVTASSGLFFTKYRKE